MSNEHELQKVIYYHTNSKQVKVEINYDKNRDTASSISYTPKGIIHIKSNYSKNMVPIDSTIYYPSGKISAKVTYDEQGRLLSAIDYDETGKEIGKVIRMTRQEAGVNYYGTKDTVLHQYSHPLAGGNISKKDPNYVYCRYKHTNYGIKTCIKYTPRGTRIKQESYDKAGNKITNVKCSAADGTIYEIHGHYDYEDLRTLKNILAPEDAHLFSIYKPY